MHGANFEFTLIFDDYSWFYIKGVISLEANSTIGKHLKKCKDRVEVNSGACVLATLKGLDMTYLFSMTLMSYICTVPNLNEHDHG